MRNLIWAAFVLVLYVNSSSGQTASDMARRYGKPVNAYTISEHIWMTPEYSADGQVCQMRLYPKRIGAANSIYLSTRRLPFEELNRVLNQLVPLDTRGVKTDSFGITATGGGAAWTTFTYERVEFIFTSSFRVDPASPIEIKPYVFSEQVLSFDRKPETKLPYDDDFIPAQSWGAEIVTVRWNLRKCTP